MRVLLYAALARYQEEHDPFDAPLALMVGLPLQMMMGDSAKDFQKGVKTWLKGSHEYAVDGITHQIAIEDVRQTSQAVGALFDYVLDDKGQMNAERGSMLQEEIGVISVGFNTLEIVVVKERGAAAPLFLHTHESGV